MPNRAIVLLLLLLAGGCIRRHPLEPRCSPWDTVRADSAAIITVRRCDG